MRNHLLYLFVLCYLLNATGILAQSFPSGFSQVEVATGISNPTVMEFLPDGRILVAQQNGVLRLIKNGSLSATPALTLSVATSGERGLLGITLHPSFNTTGLVYLYYTLPDGSRNRVSRFKMNGDVIDRASEEILLNLDPLGTTTIHNGGAMHFSGDKLFIAVGDNGNGSNGQNLNTFHGKLLRINANGSIPGDNPFYSPYTTAKQKNSVWSYGLRNPFTFDVNASTGKIFVNDVGQVTWEEINDATAKGKNFGWPASEGNTSNASYTSPVYAYAHGSGDGVGCAITGGVFFNPSSTNYPSTYRGKYFFQDFCNNWINYLDLTTGVQRRAFATGLPASSLSIDVGADGNLYYLSRGAGKLYKIIYTTNGRPVIVDQPDDITASIGQNVTFSVSATGQSPLSYQWKKNGVSISGASSSTYTISNVQTSHAGAYSVVVTNSLGSQASSSADLIVTSNTVPKATILTPSTGKMYRAGERISFSGTGSDAEDGTLSSSRLTWNLVFHHDTHVHDGPPIADGVSSGSFSIPSSGETSTNVFYRLHLTVTDSKGASSSTYFDLKPLVSTLTLKTNPPGLKMIFDYQTVATRFSAPRVEGMGVYVAPVASQSKDGVTYTFAQWAHGGASQQNFPTPVEDRSFTANFSHVVQAPWKTTEVGNVNLVGSATINNSTYTVTGAGTDIWGSSDHFRFLYREISGNGSITARVGSLTNTNGWAKAGVMIRSSLSPEARNAAVVVTPSNGVSFQRRVSDNTTATTVPGTAPEWVRITRSGDYVTAYRSADGVTWSMIGSSINLVLNSTAYFGLAVCSHSSNTLCTSTMTNVSVTGTAVSGAGSEEEGIAIEEQDNQRIKIYPNPLIEERLFIRFSNDVEVPVKVEVLNVFGQVIYEEVLNEPDEITGAREVEFSQKSGLYFVRVVSRRGTWKQSFIKN